jgi:hypothetical protein
MLGFPSQLGRRVMQDKGLDRQGALLLALGWLTALWVTLT